MWHLQNLSNHAGNNKPLTNEYVFHCPNTNGTFVLGDIVKLNGKIIVGVTYPAKTCIYSQKDAIRIFYHLIDFVNNKFETEQFGWPHDRQYNMTREYFWELKKSFPIEDLFDIK